MMRIPLILLYTCISINCIGCGPKTPSDMPKLYPTNITIMCDGKPLKGATVTMFPQDLTTGYSNIALGGVTDGTGVVKIQANGQYPGVPLGKYDVCVNKTAPIEGPTSQKPVPTDPAELETYKQKVSDERKHVPGLDKIYSSPSTSPFDIEIKEGKNSETFEVKKIPGTPDFVD